MFKKLLVSFFAILTISVGTVSAASAHTHPRKNPHPIWYAPLVGLPHWARVRVDCVIWRESTSTEAHPNLGDNNGDPGQSGIFQMSNQPGGVWDLYAYPKIHVQLWKATAYQQAEGFVDVWRVDGFFPWHAYDGC